MNQNITVTIDKKEGKAVLTLDGDITTFAEDSITQAVHTCLRDCKAIVMNFEGVEYINSSGIAVLISIVTELLRMGGKLLFVNLTPHYQKIFKMVGLNRYATIFNSLQEALSARD